MHLSLSLKKKDRHAGPYILIGDTSTVHVFCMQSSLMRRSNEDKVLVGPHANMQ